MIAPPWRVTLAEVEAALNGEAPLPPRKSETATPFYGCMAFLERWLVAMDGALGARDIYAVPDDEWIALARQAELDALSVLRPSLMARC